MKSHKYNITAIILAAGQSRRTSGQNKLLLSFHGRTILEAVVEPIIQSQFRDILIVTGYQHQRIAGLLKKYQVRTIYNPEYKEGMATSLKEGISAASDESDGFMICLGDMPLITPKILERLARKFYRNPQSAIIVPVFEGQRGNPVIFSKIYREELLNIGGDTGARMVVESHEKNVITVPISDEAILFDVDNLEDFKTLLTR